jgi:hypothetical protein
MAVDSPMCDMNCESYAWQDLQPRIKRMINTASEINMAEIIGRFNDLGFPWENSEILPSFAKLVVSASGGHGFYGDCYSQLVCALCPHCGSEERQEHLLALIEDEVAKQLCKCVSELCANEDTQLIFKLKSRLVNTSNFAGSLVAKTSRVGFLKRALPCLGLSCNLDSLQSSEADSGTAKLHETPRVFTLSGRCPQTQPLDGETVLQYRERLACELGVTSQRLSLLEGEAQVPLDSCLDQIVGILNFVISDEQIAEEYRVEAIKALLSKTMPLILASSLRDDLLQQVFIYLDNVEDELPKRAKFMSMDLRAAAATSDTAE